MADIAMNPYSVPSSTGRSLFDLRICWMYSSPSPIFLSSLLLLAAAYVTPAYAQQPAPADTVHLDLESALQQALDVSPEVDLERTQRHHAAARHQEARASRFFTDFSLNTAHSFAPGLDIPSDNDFPEDELYLNPDVENDWRPTQLRPFSNFEVVAQQPLWTWGELSGNIRAAGHATDVEAAQVDEQALEVAFRAGETYYNLLLVEALDRLADETGDVIDQAQREVQRMYDEGSEDVNHADLYQIQLTEQEYERRVVELEQRGATARTAMQRQLFLPETTTIELADREIQPIDFTPDSLEHYIALGLRNRPELEQAEAGIAAREALVDVEKSNYYPKLGLQVSYGFSYTFPERPRQDNAFIGDAYRGHSTRSGFGLQMNLNFAQTRARVEQAQAELNEVRYQQEAAEQLIQFEVEEAFRDVLTAEADVASRNEDVRITEEWLRTEQIDFDLELGDPENLVRAVQANLEAEAQYYEAVQRFNVAVLRLWRVTGVLTERAQTGTLID